MDESQLNSIVNVNANASTSSSSPPLPFEETGKHGKEIHHNGDIVDERRDIGKNEDDIEIVPTLSDKMLEDAILSPTDSLVVSETLDSIEDSAGEMEIQKSNGSATESMVSRSYSFFH